MKIQKVDIINLFAVIGFFIAHLYIIWHINYGLKILVPYNYMLGGAIVFLALNSVLSLISIKVEIPFADYTQRLGRAWMGIFAIFFICFLLNDIVNLFFKAEDFRFYSTLITLAIAFILCVWSGINVGLFLRTKKIHIGIENFKVERLKIVFIADIHIDQFTHFDKMNEMVDKVNESEPDIILLGGDISDSDISKNYHMYGLERLHAKHGIYAVTGNHEYHLGVDKFLDLCSKLNIKVLRNENVDIENIVSIAGINDEFGEEVGADTSELKKAFENINKENPIIFLSHKPDSFEEAVKESGGAKLIQLSGHTHGGQIPPMGIIGSMFFKYYYGKWKKDNSIVYITSGAGWWGPPMRLFNISEITEIILYRKRKR